MAKQLKNEVRKKKSIKILNGCIFKSRYEIKPTSKAHKRLLLYIQNDKSKSRKNVSND